MAKYFKGRAPFRKCPQPKCGAETFGVLNIFEFHYVRRCNKCEFDQMISLPRPRKAIVYLDQPAISLFVKAKLGRAPAAWIQLGELLHKAIEAQVVACPLSEFHETESAMDAKLSEQYAEFYRRVSLNRDFERAHEIERYQVIQALRMFELDNPQSSFPRWRPALREDPNAWTPDLFVVVNMQDVLGKLDRSRQVKADVAKALVGVNAYIRGSKATFEEFRKAETRQAAVNILEIYRREIQKMQAATTPQELFEAYWQGSIHSETMRDILRFYKRRGKDLAAAMARAKEFFASEYFAEMLHVKISSALWAGLSKRLQAGEPELAPSDFTDVGAISHYAPYCDAMFIDNRMRSLVTTNPVKDALNLETKFFSANNMDAFSAYLQGLIDSSPLEIKNAVDEVMTGNPNSAE